MTWNGWNAYPPAVREECLRRYRLGESAPRISASLRGRPTHTTIMEWARRAGIARTSKESSQIRADHNSYSPEERAACLTLFEKMGRWPRSYTLRVWRSDAQSNGAGPRAPPQEVDLR